MTQGKNTRFEGDPVIQIKAAGRAGWNSRALQGPGRCPHTPSRGAVCPEHGRDAHPTQTAQGEAGKSKRGSADGLLENNANEQ